LEYCQQHIYRIKELYPHLLQEYADEVNNIFLELINDESKRASTRQAYHEVCKIIGKYKKACGKKGAALVVAELQAAYPRKTAFLDELSRIR
jgi:hypothetical protein